MLRNLFLTASAALAISAQSVFAGDLATANAMLAITGPAPSGSPVSHSVSPQDLYLVCAFYPQPGTCESVYQQAMNDQSISAEAVRAEYIGYVRYLNGNGSLTDADRQWLKENNIRVPNDLSAANQTGLHNVINDASLVPDSRPVAVNNFLSRAVEAELYCGLNSCEERALATAGR